MGLLGCLLAPTSAIVRSQSGIAPSAASGDLGSTEPMNLVVLSSCPQRAMGAVAGRCLALRTPESGMTPVVGAPQHRSSTRYGSGHPIASAQQKIQATCGPGAGISRMC